MDFAEKMFGPYLDPGEKILKVCHRHPFILINEAFKVLVIGFVFPIFLYWLFPEFAVFFWIWMFIGVLRFAKIYMIWYHDALLITNVSLLDIYWNGLFDRSSTRLEYQMIEGVTQEIKGVIRTVFNFGDVTVQVMSGGDAMALKDAINPKRVERYIMEYQEKYSNQQTLRDSESLKSLLAQMVKQHAQTQDLE